MERALTSGRPGSDIRKGGLVSKTFKSQGKKHKDEDKREERKLKGRSQSVREPTMHRRNLVTGFFFFFSGF